MSLRLEKSNDENTNTTLLKAWVQEQGLAAGEAAVADVTKSLWLGSPPNVGIRDLLAKPHVKAIKVNQSNYSSVSFEEVV